MLMHASAESIGDTFICPDRISQKYSQESASACVQHRCDWRPPTVYAVCLAVDNERKLAEIEDQLIQRGIKHAAFREPDLGNSLTCIGIFPVEDRAILKPITKRIRLLK